MNRFVDVRFIAVNRIEPPAETDPDKVTAFVRLLQMGMTAPPIRVTPLYNNRYKFRIREGDHRVAAAKRAGREMIMAIVAWRDW